MYAGHVAAALAMKAREPRVPTWALVLGVGFVDVLFGIFVLTGIEHVSITPGVSPGFHLDNIDWSHSLVLSVGWALLYGAAFLSRGRVIATWCAFAVFSHFLLDFLMHPGDLALWPGSRAHVGIGLWTLVPNGWWFIELAFVLACAIYYWRRAREVKTFGGRARGVVVVLLVLHISNAPWLQPH